MTSIGSDIIDVEYVQVGTASVALAADRDRIVIGIREGRPFEPDSLRLWSQWCTGGGTIIDVGVYDGIYSISAALHGCRAIGFEPMPLNYERTMANAALNHVEFDCIRAAASDHIGMSGLRHNPRTPLTSGASLMSMMGSVLRVRTTTIDSLLEKLDGLKAIKIDVERAEPLVLRGAREALARYRPRLLVEALGDDERAKVLAELPDYKLVDVLDVRNLVLLPT